MTHPQTPKHILITHVYSSDNKGDAALTSVLMQDLRRRFPGARLSILTLGYTKPSEFEGVPQYPSFMYFVLGRYRSPLLKLLFTVYMVPATLAWAWCRRHIGKELFLPRQLKSVADMYADADLVVAVGGGYVRSRSGLINRWNIPLILHPLLFGSVLGVPTVLYSQSVGPFTFKYEAWLAAYVLKRMTLILLREDVSLRLLAQMGVKKNVRRAVDSGFLLKAIDSIDLPQTYGIKKGRLVLGVTVRAWLKDGAQEQYEKAVAAALDEIIARFNVHVLFIPQVTAAKGDDDRTASRRVYHHMEHAQAATVIMDEPDHHRIKAIYDGLDLLLGTRFHSVIFSLTSYVPVAAIEYEHKTSGIMSDLGLDDWVIGIEHITAARLVEMLEKLIAQRKEYGDYLRVQLPAYIKHAEETVNVLAESYYGSGPAQTADA